MSEPLPHPEYLTSKEVAAILRIHEKTVRRKANAGQLRYFREGQEFRFRRVDVDAYVAAKLTDEITTGSQPRRRHLRVAPPSGSLSERLRS